jgi:hypothetical protein
MLFITHFRFNEFEVPEERGAKTEQKTRMAQLSYL